ncbi:hypothetical protein DXG01_001876 [Tephrocybe rancida]|nr:hypothetical protein DXG01_001876 [Tephrocybe rancida]
MHARRNVCKSETVNNFKENLSSDLKQQAEALGRSFAGTTLTAIHSSPLERAFLTAKALQTTQPNFVSLETSPLLREQSFGVGEGQSYDVQKESHLSFEEHVAQGKYIQAYNRSDRYPGGESLNDVARRAETVVEDIMLPYMRQAAKEGIRDMHIVFVSHGIFIAELISALACQGGKKPNPIEFRHLKNTGWTLVTANMTVGD